MPIFIKEKNKGFNEMEVGILLEPDVQGLVSSDAELYALLWRYHNTGNTHVKIAEGLFGSKGVKKITVKEFCARWKGD